MNLRLKWNTISDIGQKCRKWRVEHGLYQDRISETAGTCQSSVSAFEHGRYDSLMMLLAYIANGMPLEVITDDDR